MTLSFTHVTKRYRAVTAVDDYSTEVQPGRITAFLGPNGSGKTTSMGARIGLTVATAVGAVVFGLTVSIAIPLYAAKGVHDPPIDIGRYWIRATLAQDVLSPAVALLVLLGWTAVIAVIATAVNARRKLR